MGQGEDLSHSLSCTLFREVIKDHLSQSSAAAERSGNADSSTSSTRVSGSFCFISMGSEDGVVMLLGCPPPTLPPPSLLSFLNLAHFS